MKYLNRRDLVEIGLDWQDVVNVIYQATQLLDEKDVIQPIKPYLRYKDISNRIIAMPAYVGGDIATAGIKWIASFPGNAERNLPRAHSIVILNDETTGVPIATINTPLISGIRTAGVTGAILSRYVEHLPENTEKFSIGIIGFGPIGQLHLDMVCELFPNLIDKIFIYDIKGVDINNIKSKYRNYVVIASSWQDVYNSSRVFITCTVSSTPYINIPPPKGTLQLNISLRDYHAEIVKYVDVMIVDDWEEICRENTDVERMHIEFGLTKSDVIEISRAIDGNNWNDLDSKVIMFNPMGMAIYDIAISKYYLDKSIEQGIGLILEE